MAANSTTMVFFIILMIVCSSGLLLALRPNKDSYWQEDCEAKLICPLEDEEGNKWLAQVTFEGTKFYVIVNTSNQHQVNDCVRIQSTNDVYEIIVYDEIVAH